MEISPQTLQEFIKVASTQQGSQLYTVMIFGALCVVAMVWLVWVIVGARLSTVEKLEDRLEKLQEVLTSINKKIWTEENLMSRIENVVHKELDEHVRNYHPTQVVHQQQQQDR